MKTWSCGRCDLGLLSARHFKQTSKGRRVRIPRLEEKGLFSEVIGQVLNFTPSVESARMD